MKKWLSGLLLLLLFSGAALADAASPTIASTAVSQKTDISIAYLSSIFGTVSGVLTGTSGQMFGKLMYQFNQGMLVVAGLWLAFTVLSMVFKSATSGSFMQQDNKVPMIFLRVALGFALLIPNPSTGYTLLQGIVMQVTVQGVKLANQVWEYGLDYLSNGGALWSRPVQQFDTVKGNAANANQFMTNSDFKAILGDSTRTPETVIIGPGSATPPNPPGGNFNDVSFVQKIMAMEACMVKMSINLTMPSGDSSDTPSNNTPLSIYEDEEGYKFEFPAGYATNKRSTGCGAVYWTQLAGKDQNAMACSSSSSDNSSCGFAHLAIREVIFDVYPAVKKWVCLNTKDSDQSPVCSGVEDSGGSYMNDAMMSATLNYKNLIDPMVRKDALASEYKLKSGKDPLRFIGKAKADGWMTAGRYYWDLLRIEDAYDSAISNTSNYANYIPAEGGYVIPWSTASGTVPTQDALDTATGLMKQTTGDQDANNGSDGFIKLARNDIDNFTGAASAGNAAIPSRASTMASMGSLKVIFAVLPFFLTIISDIIELIMTFSAYTGTVGLGSEPILWLHKLGLTCMSLGLNIWLGFAISLFPFALATWFCKGVSSLADASSAVINWLKPLILAGAGGLIVVGFSLGFYLPLHPYVLFTFGVIGWLIAVVEAMVAAPLVALGITHPEGGHDFIGRAGQAVMLLVGLFLRPVLMLIGLFAAMILCQVSLSIILYTFSGFCADIFYLAQPVAEVTPGDPVLQAAGNAMANTFSSGRGAGFGMLLMTLLVFPMFLGFFAMIVYTATVSCFSVIHQLVTYVLGWIGGPNVHGADPQSMADQFKQGVSGMAHKLGEGIGHTPQAGKKGPSSLKAPPAPKEAPVKSKNVRHGGSPTKSPGGANTWD